jgi:hypothetical protein
MEFLIGGVIVVALLGSLFYTLKVRQGRRFESIGGAPPGPYDPDESV